MVVATPDMDPLLASGSCKVTKKEIVKRISEDLGRTQLQTKDIVQRTLDAIIQSLVTVGRIELRNFGVFEVKRRASHKARNPRTGETLIAPAKNVVTFKPGREMEDRVGGMVVERNPQAAREDATDHPSSGSSPKPKKKVSSNPE
jgi:integration host factor subunit beta